MRKKKSCGEGSAMAVEEMSKEERVRRKRENNY